MHGLTGGGWKRTRYRLRSPRKLTVGKPRPGAPRPTAEPFATAPAPDPPRLGLRRYGVSALVRAVTAALSRVCANNRICRGRRGSECRP
jgi:hypothetical protein